MAIQFEDDPVFGVRLDSREPNDYDVWRFMLDYQEKNGMPPTLEEIAEGALAVEWRSSAQFRVQRLVEARWVEVVAEPGKSRRYRAVGPLKVDFDDPLEHLSTSRQFGGPIR